MESAQIFAWPRGGAPSPVQHQPEEAVRCRRLAGFDIVHIARRLKMVDRPLRAIIAAVRVLIEKEGFPPPASPRIVKGRRLTGPQSVWVRSIWDRDDVELWFEGDQPPPVAARARNARRETVRAQLAEAAARLAAA